MTSSAETVPPSVIQLWDEIGLTQEERDEEVRKMNEAIERVRSDFISSTVQECQQLTQSIDEIKEKHIKYLKALKAPESDIEKVNDSGKEGTIKKRYEEVRDSYTEYMKIVRKRIGEFQEDMQLIELYSYNLGIPPEEQGEFGNLGEEDLTLARLERFHRKVQELNDEVDRKSLQFDKLSKSIQQNSHDLQEDIPEHIQNYIDKKIYSQEAFDALQEYLDELRSVRETRVIQISEKAVEITRLWDLLEIDDDERRAFLNSHSALSHKNIQDCNNEINRLTEIRNQNLPILIRNLKKQIISICDDLSYSEEQKHEILERCEKQNQENIDTVETEEPVTKDAEEKTDEPQITGETTTEVEKPVESAEQAPKEEEIKPQEEEQQPAEQPEEQPKAEEENKPEDSPVEPTEEKKDDEVEIKPEQQEEQNEITEQTEEQEVTEILVDPDERTEIEIRTEDTEQDRLINYFNNLDTELLHLKRVHLVAQPIIDLIQQREEVIEEFNSAKAAVEGDEAQAGKGQKKGKRAEKKPDPQQLLHIEKVSRRYKSVLPRIEKKLKLLLIEFKEQNEEDFIWNSKPIIESLEHVKLSNSEVHQAKTAWRKKSVSKNTVKPSTEGKPKATSARAQRKSVAPQAPAPPAPPAAVKSSRVSRKSTAAKHVHFKPQ